MRNYRTIKELNLQIAAQCAPLMAGIKISNILITHVSNKNDVYEIFKGTKIQIKCLYVAKEKITFYLYREDKLYEYLQKEKVRQLMLKFGYKNLKLSNMLRILSRKFTLYMNHKTEFPHELGIFLGYPIEDVKGFIVNKGRNSLFTGYWKVYTNLGEALVTFEKYHYAKNKVKSLVMEDISIGQILKLYHKDESLLDLNVGLIAI